MTEVIEIHIHNLNINTKDDPKNIKDALKQAISEIQSQCKR